MSSAVSVRHPDRVGPVRSLLLVCRANLCRSPMAAALFAARARELRHPLRVASAGIAVLSDQSPPTPVIELMAHRGLDLSYHRAQQLTGLVASRHELILVMERAQQQFIELHWSELKGRIYRLGAWRDWDIADPFGRGVDSYLDCLACLEACVGDWAPRLMSRVPPHRSRRRRLARALKRP